MNAKGGPTGREGFSHGWGRLLHVAAPVAIGAVVYVLWRSERLLVFSWLGLLGLQEPVAHLRVAASGLAVPDVVVFTLPDGLWAYALSYSVALVWAGGPHRSRTLWFVACLLLTVGVEACQFFRLVPGTFDPADLVASAGGLQFGWFMALRGTSAPHLKEVWGT